jgi:hypothetical protein
MLLLAQGAVPGHGYHIHQAADRRLTIGLQAQAQGLIWVFRDFRRSECAAQASMGWTGAE